MMDLLNRNLIGDLPPPPPFSLFSGDAPAVALSIAVILAGVAMAAFACWVVVRRQRSR